MDRHQGPGMAIDYGLPQGMLGLSGSLGVQAFGYYKLDGINTDQSLTIGLNLSYARF
jgi:hypothetical protein